MKTTGTLLAFAAILAGLLMGWCSADQGQPERTGETNVVARLGVRL